MLPTPAKFHYIFNLRDLSRIWEGILHVAATECPEPDNAVNLWASECVRVIADRFTNEQDCLWFQKVITVHVQCTCSLFMCAQNLECTV